MFVGWPEASYSEHHSADAVISTQRQQFLNLIPRKTTVLRIPRKNHDSQDFMVASILGSEATSTADVLVLVPLDGSVYDLSRTLLCFDDLNREIKRIDLLRWRV